MYINKNSPIPAYYQLKKIIVDRIESGEYREGTLIPSERDLCEAMNISRMTVRQALNELVAEGVLYREKGRGTFVSKMKFEQRNIMSFSDIVRNKGLTPSTRVLKFTKEHADQEIRDALELRENDVVYNLKRLRLADNVPIAVEEVFIPEKYCPGLERYDLTASLYRIIKAEYSHSVSYVDNVIEASKATKDERDQLQISSSVPVMRTTNIYFLATGLKLLYERAIYRSDEYKYSVRVYVNKEQRDN